MILVNSFYSDCFITDELAYTLIFILMTDIWLKAINKAFGWVCHD